MNSYYTTLNEYLKNYGGKKQGEKVYENGTDTVILDIDKKGKFIFSDIDGSWAGSVKEHHEYYENTLPAEVKNFLSVVHTIGNFIPVPFKEGGIEFNRPRGLNQKIQDYWDLTLLGIYNYFHNMLVANISLKTIVKNDESVELCEKWLNNYKINDTLSWDRFVEVNFLQDFVTYDYSTNSYGLPKELWKGHYAGCNVLPQNKDDFIQFFNNATTWIISRGQRIAVELKNAVEQ